MTRDKATTGVSNNSWAYRNSIGPHPVSRLWTAALESGVNEGYGGKGVFYVFSAGNRHEYGQDIGFHEGKNFYAQTTVCAVDADGKRASYSQTGYALWICAPEGKATTDNWNRYMDSFPGTSSATPIVSGAAALIRSANNGLTWRDVKVILAQSATKNDPTNAGWETGASMYGSDSGRYHYNPEYGFGVVNASATVALASDWTNLPPMVKTTSKVEVAWPQNRIPDATEGTEPTPFTNRLSFSSDINFTEFVEVNIDLLHGAFRDLEITLESPSGTVSTLTVPRDEKAFNSPSKFANSIIRFGSARHLGEDPNGEWTLTVEDHYPDDSGLADEWSITVYGHVGGVPNRPSGVSVSKLTGGLSVSWNARSAGATPTSYKVQWKASSDSWAVQDSVSEAIISATSTLAYTITELTDGTEYSVRVIATNASGDSPPSTEVAATPGSNPATGAPTIRGTAQVGQTLTASTSGIRDDDGLTGAVYSYQWIANDGTTDGEIPGATSSAYSLTDAEVGRTIKVRVSFTDDAGNPEVVTSSSTAAVAHPPLTARFEEMPSSHDGATDFTFRLYFSKEVDISYRDFTGSVFQVTGGTARKARRLAPPSNIGWEITMGPGGNDNVVISLPGDRACDVAGAICTSEDERLSASISATIRGPGRPAITSAATFAVAEGTATVATLTADDDNTVAADLTWSIPSGDAGGADAGKFTITAAGALSFTAAKDYEAPDDADYDGAYRVTVQVSDGQSTDTADLTVTLTDANEAPTANAGSDQTNIEQGSTVTLSGSGSDPDAGQSLSYAWTQTAGDTVSLSDDGAATTTFTAPTGLSADTVLTFTLRVTDDDGLYHEDEVSITVDSPELGLMARFEEMPTSHDGSTDFTFRLYFSEEIVISYRDFSGSVFQVTGGTALKARRLAPPSNIGWEITVGPTGDDNVVITLPGSRACDVAGAICTSDGDRLQGSISATVSGPAPTVPAPVATITQGTTPVAEGAAASFTVSLDRAAPATLSVAVSVVDAGGVLSGAAPTSVAFAEGDNSKTLTLPTQDDNVIKTTSTVMVSLVTGSGYTLGTTTSASVSVEDNDTATWTASAQPAEIAEGGSSTITVAVANGKTFASNQTISLAVSGTAASSDYSLSATELRAGESSATATVSATDDAIVEGDETVTVTASHGGQSIGSATVTISDNDDATWTVSAQPTEIDEAESSTITVAVANGKTFASNQTVNLAVSGTAASSDYSLSATELTLRAGESSATATVTATDDVIVEGDETVTVAASHGGQSVGSATVTIEANDSPPSNDASLSSLALTGVEIGAFDSGTTGYTAIVGYDVSSTTVTADPNDDGASVTIADANGSTQGTSRAVSLSSGDNVIIVTVTAEDGNTTKVYSVTVTRAEPGVAWGERLPDRDIALGDSAKPTDLWSDGSKVWVITDWDTGQVRVYSLADGALQSDLGFTLTGTVFPAALWSDGQTLWAADYSAGRVLAYRLSDGSRLSGQDFDQAVMSAAGNNRPSGLWSDGQTMWVADYSASKVFAYRLSDKARASALEFDLTADQNGTPISPFGLWSDGETMLASNWQRGEIFVYTLSGGQRQPNRNIDTSESGTSYPSGLWSDGETLWVVDDLAKRIYAYAVPGLG